MKRTVLACVIAACLPSLPAAAEEHRLELRPADHIAYIGNTLADRMQHHGWLETYIHALHPEHDLTFRNLGFPGDEVETRMRSANFGSPDEWLTKVQADVVFCFFGYNEALRGEDGLEEFRKELGEMIDGMRAQEYNGQSAPRLVVFSPIAHEDLQSRHLPDGSENNRKLELYTGAMRQVCAGKEARFVDLFTPTRRLYAETGEPLTMNGIHLLDRGNRALAGVIIEELFGVESIEKDERYIARLREAVLDKNYHWFSRYRVVDGYNVYGGRSKLAWFGQSNADVMKREMEMLDIMTANRDERVWAVARGEDLEVEDDNLPPPLEVKTNKPGPLDGGGYPYLDGEEAISEMDVHDGMKANLFASEEMFPRLVNPVQMAVDTDSRLWVSVWPSYPHWNPRNPRRDALVILPDEDLDGVADECIVFADELNSITSFEFWGGGVLVAAPPEIWFLEDTDGDDRADRKIRMLQGLSSADTHHTANAMLIGPDGWLYWSRGIFNVSNIETPTRTFRSGRSGVYRFNPRTFEVEFHFPIGPNPHGDVFDRWGYQFASDGTSGTGRYVNIGKGVGNKQWYEKRVRPVSATGILSSGHFPDRFQGNFLICNTIGFLGVLQHEVRYNGAEIRAVEIDPILVSSDPNFRPSDLEIGGDGALYVSDWHNALIGHMQHNMRDPNRDHSHGRIYRVTYEGRPLSEPPKMDGKPVREVCEHFYAEANAFRYRARLELTGRDSEKVAEEVSRWAADLDATDPADAQALLECLWVFEQHRMPNRDLLTRVLRAEEPRVRAAAIRTLGHWGPEIEDWEPLLLSAARDGSALVRAEAAKAAVSFEGLAAADAIFEVATRPTDPELDRVLEYARGQLRVDELVQEAIRSDEPLSEAAKAYTLRNASVRDLLRLEPSEAVYETILRRPDAPRDALREALRGLAGMRDTRVVSLLLELIETRGESGRSEGVEGPGALLAEQPPAELAKVRGRLEELATSGRTATTRRLAYAAWIAADRSGDAAFLAASESKARLRDLLAAVPAVEDEALRSELYDEVRSLVFELPPNLEPEGGAALRQSGIRVDYFHPSARDVALETLAGMEPEASGVVPRITMDVPQRKQADRFALRFAGTLHVPEEGRYTFFVSSDDGSRIYLGGRLLVNNDGLHGMSEKRASVELPAGPQRFVVTYFDNGGNDGLAVSWAGPGFGKEPIPAGRLSVGGGETVHDVAIRALTAIPGHDEEKFIDLATLVKAGKHRASAIRALRSIPEEHRAVDQAPALVDNLIGYLSTLSAAERTGGPAQEALALAKSLSRKLPADASRAAQERLENLNVRVIAIGTVPARMIYDKERIVVEAGKPVEFRFSNSDNMPHNLSVVLPGSLREVGELAEATANDPGAAERDYIPPSDKILVSSRLLEPGEKQTFVFEVPDDPDVYPYVCTYPGHWRRMNGALYVVEDLEQYLADPEAYLAANPMPIRDELLKYTDRNTDWKVEDLAGSVNPLPEGRSFEVGENIFRVANCIACHKIGDEGQELGPDLTALEDEKHSTEYILRSILKPSEEVAEDYQSNTFVLASGRVVNGMVVEESAGQVEVLVDPLAKAAPVVIDKGTVLQRERSPTSIMPEGLLDKLTEEEILDLIAYIYARAEKGHELFAATHPSE